MADEQNKIKYLNDLVVNDSIHKLCIFDRNYSPTVIKSMSIQQYDSDNSSHVLLSIRVPLTIKNSLAYLQRNLASDPVDDNGFCILSENGDNSQYTIIVGTLFKSALEYDDSRDSKRSNFYDFVINCLSVKSISSKDFNKLMKEESDSSNEQSRFHRTM